METERTMVSSAVENGRWKRAIGLRKSMYGHELVAMTRPKMPKMPRCSGSCLT